MSKSILNTNKPSSFAIMKEDGLSLIEVCIALIIIGALTVPWISEYKALQERNMLSMTDGHLSNSEEAITNFYISGNEHYPCPASLTAGLGDAEFGKEVDECALDTDISDIERCTNLAWLTLGICKTSDNPAVAVIIGAVPSISLKLSQGQELDAWGNKLIYAVGFNQTQTANFHDGNVVTALFPDDPEDPAADGIPDQPTDGGSPASPQFYQYVIISTGSNGFGGFSKDGVQLSECPNPANDMTELENCDLDDTFIMRTDINVSGASMASYNAAYYDDFTLSFSSIINSVWYGNTTNTDVAMTEATRVGIGTQEPEASLHIADRTQENANLLIAGQVDGNGDPILDNNGEPLGGKLKTDDVCGETTDNNDNVTVDCFNPEIIAGDVPEMECAGDIPVNELSNSRVTCGTTEDADGNAHNGNSLSTNDTFSGECTEEVPNGDDINRPATGFNSSGDLQCN